MHDAYLPPGWHHAFLRQRWWLGELRAQQLRQAGGGPRFKEPPLKISEDADRYDHREGNDDYTQAGNLYRLLPQDERERLHAAIAKSMDGVPWEIIERQLVHFGKADPAYADGVRQALGIR